MAFRTSGSFLRFHVAERGYDPADPELLKLFKRRRFRSIEAETAEIESVGWVTPADPSGASWRGDEVVRDQYLFLRMRMDKKAVPAAWMRIKLAEAERAERATGKKITRAVKQELREAIVPELLAQTLPSVSMVDVVWNVQRQLVYLFSTSVRAEESLGWLWVRTFDGEPPVPVEPETLISRLKLPAAARSAWQEMKPLQLSLEGRADG